MYLEIQVKQQPSSRHTPSLRATPLQRGIGYASFQSPSGEGCERAGCVALSPPPSPAERSDAPDARQPSRSSNDAYAGYASNGLAHLTTQVEPYQRSAAPLAKARPYTSRAPALFSVLAHSASVNPVVKISSTTITVFPRTNFGCVTANAPLIFCRLSIDDSRH